MTAAPDIETIRDALRHVADPEIGANIVDLGLVYDVDVAGNGQMLTIGNLKGNDRVMLFLIDYQNAARLKIWGRARLIDNVIIEPDPAPVGRAVAASCAIPSRTTRRSAATSTPRRAGALLGRGELHRLPAATALLAQLKGVAVVPPSAATGRATGVERRHLAGEALGLCALAALGV